MFVKCMLYENVGLSKEVLVYPYFNKFFSIFQYGLWREFNVDHCLKSIFGKWLKFLVISGRTGAASTDFSKAIYCIGGGLLINS